VNDYDREFTQAWDRTLRFGLALPPIRLQVRKYCIDLAKALPVNWAEIAEGLDIKY
jgi:hypothetical protein